MRPARIALFLPLCLVATVVAQSPEQEMQTEAQKLLPTLFSKCGEDYFSKRTYKYKTGGEAWVIGQYRGLAPRITQQKVMKRDAAKGIEWKGTIQFIATSSREFSHGMHFTHGQRVPQTLNAWTDWKPVANLTTYNFHIEKRNGQINITRRPPQGRIAIPCNEVPPG